MTFFPDKTLQRYTLSSISGAGVYGETVQEYTYTDDIIVDFQNESNNEIAHSYGVELKDLYKIYTDLSTTLLDTDELHDTDGNIYTIIGGVQRYPKFHKYQKAHIVRRRDKCQLTSE